VSTKKKPKSKKESKAKKQSTSKGKAGGARSPRAYPRRSLESALRVPSVIKEKNGGNPWASEDVAKALGMSPNSSEFFYVTASARDYGLTEGTRDTAQISLTELGRELVYAPSKSDEEALKVNAFFKVSLFERVF
jgi:hypothetical protein